MMGVVTTALDSLLEGFAAEPPVLDGRLRIGDRVRVPVKGQDSVVGRVVRPSDSKPATHLLVAPEGGGPHVEAVIKSATHDTPERHGRERAERQAEFEAQGPQVPANGRQDKPGPMRESILGKLVEGFEDARHPRDFHGRFIKKGRRGPRAAESERAGIGLLVEAFKAPAPPAVAGINAPSPGETVAQSMARGAASVRTARAELAANAAWNSSKHPRGAAGKFAYSTGGKRAHVGSSKHTLSTKGYGNYVGVGARGALVQSVQRQLGIKADGVYGQQTRAAIMRFQTNHGLRVDGVIGQQTITALRGRSGAAKIAPGPLSVKTARVVKHKPRVRAPVMIGGGVRIG